VTHNACFVACFALLVVSTAQGDLRVTTLPPPLHLYVEIDPSLIALHDEDPVARENAVLRLGAFGDEASVRILEQVLIDPEPRVREAAVFALADAGGESAARVLAFALHDEDPGVREEVVYALGEIGGESAFRLLHRALAYEEGSVRESAFRLLAEIETRRAAQTRP